MSGEPEEKTGFGIKKKVDESWKNSIEKEKHNVIEGEGEPEPQDSSFSFFISTLGMQALTALGELANPATGEKRKNLDQAQYFIDLIQMLSDKTKNNLTPEESGMIATLLYELRLKFVQQTQSP